MTWLLLMLVMILQAVGAYMSYTKNYRDWTLYMPYMFAVSITSSLIWCISTRLLNNTQKILYYSLVWDTALFLCYYAIPLTLYRQELSWKSVVGAVLVLTGLVIVKLSM